MNQYWIVALIMVVLLGLLIPGCAAKPVTQSSPPTAVPPLNPPTPSSNLPVAPTTPPSSVSAGTLADAGKTVYLDSCASCHGVDGMGSGRRPAVTGLKANLGKYGTAQGLYDYISKKMPLGAGGSLSQQAYTSLIVFLLVQNGFVSLTSPINVSQLSSVPLTAK